MVCARPTNPALVLFLLLSSPSFAFPNWSRLWTRYTRMSQRTVPEEGYYSPLTNGGSLLTIMSSTWPPGLGEPLNMIISGNSDAKVLVDQQDNGGLKNFFLSLSFSTECLGQHLGSHQGANLGDGNGPQNETAVIRYNYGDPYLGTCKETVQGGNHFRYWIQNGRDANSGAIFMACSYEHPVDLNHDIVRDGYNLGRDYIVGNITGVNPPPSHTWPTNTTTYTGQTFSEGWVYDVDVKYVALAPNTSVGVNHEGTVVVNGRGPMDGLVAVLTVKIHTLPANATSASTSHSPSLAPSIFASLATIFLGILSPFFLALP